MRAHIKITQQWKSTLRQHLVPLTSHERFNKRVGFGPVHTYQFLIDNGEFSFSLTYRRMFRFQTKPETCGRDLCHLRWQRGTKAMPLYRLLRCYSSSVTSKDLPQRWTNGSWLRLLHIFLLYLVVPNLDPPMPVQPSTCSHPSVST